MDIKGKKVTVVGLGSSGVNAAILLAQKGASVRATEAKDNPATRAAAKLLSEKGAEVERENKEFFDRLTDAEKEKIQPVIEQLGNPSGVPFISPKLKQLGALGNSEFIKYSLEILGDSSANEGRGIHGFHPLHTAPSLLVAT